jgi:Membrane domain of glycerophosphoryl diester phosphodiesterase
LSAARLADDVGGYEAAAYKPSGGEVVPASSFTPQLRPLSVGEILDAGFKLFRARFGALLLAVLVPVLPLAIVGTIVVALTDEHYFDVSTTEVDDSGSAIAGNLIGVILQGLAIALAIAACFKIISAAYLGEETSVGDSLRFGISRIAALIVAYILLSVILIVSFFLLFIPFVYFSVKFAMTFPAIVFERKGPFGAMGRSFSLTRGNFWRVLGTLVVVFLLLLVMTIALSVLIGVGLFSVESASEAVVAVVYTALNVIVIALTYPLFAAILTVIYYDLRVRNEGFDLQLLARGVGADESRFAAAPERPVAPAPEPARPAGGGFLPPTA